MRAARKIFSFSFVFLWFGCSAGGSPAGGGHDDPGLTGNEDLGRIEGRVTVGPLCPVERIPPDPRCLPGPAVFADLKVRILTPAGALLRVVDLDDSGIYAVDLAPASYLVDTNHRGFGLPRGLDPGTGAPAGGPPVVEDPGGDGGAYRTLPVAVEVQAGRSIRVDIDIDTGIR